MRPAPRRTTGGRRTAAPRPPGPGRSPGRSPRPRHTGGRELAWNRGSTSPRRQVRGRQVLEHRPVLAVDLEHAAIGAGGREGSRQRGVIDAEVVDHEGLEGRHAGGDRGRQLGDGSSWLALITRLTAMSTAESWSVAARHSSRPASRLRAAAGEAPVPGLLNARKVVVPPNAAATESWKNRSGSASLATRVWVWTSTTPGSTSNPSASTTSRADSAMRPDPARSPTIRPASIGDVGPPRALDGRPPSRRGTSRSVTRSSLDLDRLGPLPERPPADLAKTVLPALVGQDRREVVGRELADLRARRAGAVREEDLALADATRIDRELTRRRVRCVVLVVDARPEVAERDPASTRRSSGSG